MRIEMLEQLYRARYPRFLRLALAIVGSREAATDVVQEAFAQAIRHRGQLRNVEAMESWLWKTVINTARNQTKRERLQVRLESLEEIGAPSGRSGPWPELRAGIAALPERQREVLFLRHYADLGYEQIAEVLGIARGTVAATLHAAHSSLRRTLEGAHT